MRSFMGISNHGPYVGIGFSRHHGRRRSTHYARSAGTALGPLVNQFQANADRARLDAIDHQMHLTIAAAAADLADANARALDMRLAAERNSAPEVLAARADAALLALKAEMGL